MGFVEDLIDKPDLFNQIKLFWRSKEYVDFSFSVSEDDGAPVGIFFDGTYNGASHYFDEFYFTAWGHYLPELDSVLVAAYEASSVKTEISFREYVIVLLRVHNRFFDIDEICAIDEEAIDAIADLIVDRIKDNDYSMV